MKESYSTHEFFVREDEEFAILISEHGLTKNRSSDGDNALGCRNAKIEIDLPEFHIELFMPEDALRELAEKAQRFLGKKEEEVRN